jgi:hypothetical protein
MDRRSRSLLGVVGMVAAACGGGGGAADGGPGDAAPEPDAMVALPPAMCEATLDCGGVEIPDDPRIACDLRIEDGDGGVAYDGRVSIERRGRSSAAFPKPQYALELQTEAGAPSSVDLFGMGGEADWILNGMWIDRALFRNALVYDMWRSLGEAHYAAESRYCRLTLDGDPRGVYVLTEKVERDDDRVAIDDDGGVGASFVLKQDDADGFHAIGVANGVWQMIYPRQATATTAQLDGVVAWLEDLEAAVGGAPDADIFDLVDLDSAVDFVLFEELLKNVDSFYLSMHVWKDVGGKLRFTPWDVDLSFGQPLYGAGNETAGWIEYRPALIQAFAADARFQARLVARWSELREELFTAEAMWARIDFFLRTYGDDVAANFERWPIEEVEFGVGWTGSNQLYPVSSHAEELELIAAWLDARLLWVDDHIAAYAAGD